jgi:hypothetical protein
MSLNESGLLSKSNILAATLVHFHRIICTTIMRVGMTQSSLLEAMRRINNLRVTLAGVVNAHAGRGQPPRCRRFFATSAPGNGTTESASR